MDTLQQRRDYLVEEMTRLGGIVEAARLTGRNVDLQRALLVHHGMTLAELNAEAPTPPSA